MKEKKEKTKQCKIETLDLWSVRQAEIVTVRQRHFLSFLQIFLEWLFQINSQCSIKSRKVFFKSKSSTEKLTHAKNVMPYFLLNVLDLKNTGLCKYVPGVV